MGTQLLAEQPNQLAAARRRHISPNGKCRMRLSDLRLERLRGVARDASNLAAVDRGVHRKVPGLERLRIQMERCKN